MVCGAITPSNKRFDRSARSEFRMVSQCSARARSTEALNVAHMSGAVFRCRGDGGYDEEAATGGLWGGGGAPSNNALDRSAVIWFEMGCRS
jgi:hypothetical protein